MAQQRSVTILTQGHLYGIGATPLTKGFVTGGTSSPPPPSVQKFFFDSVELPEQNVVRARFNDVPVVGSGSSSIRADVVSNWTLKDSQGHAIPIQLATPFAGDPEVIDLLLFAPLPAGGYTLTVASTVKGSDPVPVSPPYTVTFTLAVVEQDRISQGAVDNPATVGTQAAIDAGSSKVCEDLLQRLINPAFRGKKKWSAYLAGIAAGDCIVRQQAESAIDQLYIASASGKYLTTRASDRGVGRPSKMGTGDVLFRQLATSVVNSKLTQEAFLEMLEVMYGVDAVSAFAEFGPELYVLFEGAELNFTLDGVFPVKVDFQRQDFDILRRATALEAAAAVTRAINEQQPDSGGYAVAKLDPTTGVSRLRVYSGSRGLHSSVSVGVSTAAIALQPPTNVFPPPDPLPAMPVWEVSTLPGGRARYSLELNTLISLDSVLAGDYLVVLGYEFSPGNRGAFLVENVSFSYAGSILTQYVDVTNPAAAVETVAQLRLDSAQFFRQSRETVYNATGYVTVAQARGESLVSIPATTRAVNRHATSGAYLQPPRDFGVEFVGRQRDGLVTIDTSLSTGLVPGQQFILDDVAPDLAKPAGTGGSTGGAYDGSGSATGTTRLQQVTDWNPGFTFQGVDFKTIKDLDGDIWFVGGNTTSNSGVPTPKNSIEAFRVVSETVDAAFDYQSSYRWTRMPSLGPTYNLGTALGVAQDHVNRNRILLAGGYLSSPWGSWVSFNLFETAAKLVTKLPASPWFSIASAGSLSSSVAEASAAWISGSNKFMLTGGVYEQNHATNVVQEGLTSWSNDAGGMKRPRCQHASVPLDSSHVMVIGGRQPADNQSRIGVFSSWDFEEPTGNFSGPVTVFRASNTQLVGKIGSGLYLVGGASSSSGGGSQTTLNTNLLGSWTICGWMTAGQGCVLRNGTATWTNQNDNTLIAFGVDPADDKFFVRWNQSVIHNTITKKTAATRAQLMGANLPPFPYPRYHHFVITKVVNGVNATFTLYINGKQAGQWTDLKPDGGSGGIWSFGQGDSNSPTVVGFGGCVDAVGFSTTTIFSANDVAAQYRKEVGVLYENPNDSTASPVGNVLNSCEIVTASTGSSKFTGPMSDARFAAAIVQLPDGRIVAAGGVGYNPSSPPDPATPQRGMELRTAEIYSPGSGIWTPLPRMRDPHSYCSAGYVAAENRVYVSGGFTSNLLEYLDLNTMTWHVSSTYPVGFEKAHAGGGVAGNRTLVLAGGAVQNTSGTHPVYDTATQGALDFSTPVGAETWAKGGLNGMMTALAGTSGTTIVTKTRGGVTNSPFATVTPAAARPALAGMPGPYVYDPLEGVGIGSVKGKLSAALREGVRYPSLQLQTNEALLFPDSPGYLVVNFGKSGQVGPLRYLGRLNASALRLDAGFLWTADSVVNSEVRLLKSRSGLVPDSPQSVGSFYLTASNAGLAGAKKFLAEISAAGIDLKIDVRYPGDRGLGGEGFPDKGAAKLSSVVEVFGSDDLDAEVEELRSE